MVISENNRRGAVYLSCLLRLSKSILCSIFHYQSEYGYAIVRATNKTKTERLTGVIYDVLSAFYTAKLYLGNTGINDKHSEHVENVNKYNDKNGTYKNKTYERNIKEDRAAKYRIKQNEKMGTLL